MAPGDGLVYPNRLSSLLGIGLAPEILFGENQQPAELCSVFVAPAISKTENSRTIRQPAATTEIVAQYDVAVNRNPRQASPQRILFSPLAAKTPAVGCLLITIYVRRFLFVPVTETITGTNDFFGTHFRRLWRDSHPSLVGESLQTPVEKIRDVTFLHLSRRRLRE